MARDPGFIWHRVKLDYFRRRPPFRPVKFGLCIGCALLAAVWVTAGAIRSDHSAFSSGAMSAGHRMLADQCHKCHTEAWHSLRDVFGSSEADQAMNRACLTCHGASIGHDPSSAVAFHQASGVDQSSPEPWVGCASCHAEHEGPQRLSAVADATCIRCHENLTESLKTTPFHAQISGFDESHPEIRVLARREPDQAKIALNHRLHLSPLRGRDGSMIQMSCADCHRAGPASAPWPYGTPTRHESIDSLAAHSEPTLQSAYMTPIRYSLHCQACHELTVDRSGERIPERSVPHETPRTIRTFLRGRLTEFAANHPEAIEAAEKPPGGARFTLRELPPKEADRLRTEWVNEQVGLFERLIYIDGKTCTKCHEYGANRDADGLPVIAPPEIPYRWFAHASFDHERHRTIDCLECHATVGSSTATTDVLLPGIETCRACHAPRTGRGESAAGGVSTECALCHTFHRPPTGNIEQPTRSIRDLIGHVAPIGTKATVSR